MNIRTAKTAAVLAAAALTVLTLVPQPAEARSWRYRDYARTQVDIVQRLEQQGNFTVLLAALDQAGLTSTVASARNITLLAPTDEAFANLLAELQIEPGDLLASPQLADILLYHVLPDRYRTVKLLQRNTVETLYDNQPVLAVRDNRFRTFINGNMISRANLKAGNGLIQVLDGVLLPPADPIQIQSTLDVLRLDGRFTVLLAALETAGLSGAVETGTLTLLAPTDEAFVNLLNELNVEAEDLLANPALPEILLYHAIEGRKSSVNLLFRPNVETLQGDTVRASYRNGYVMINDANVINPNILTPTGLIQVLDTVLLP